MENFEIIGNFLALRLEYKKEGCQK